MNELKELNEKVVRLEKSVANHTLTLNHLLEVSMKDAAMSDETKAKLEQLKKDLEVIDGGTW